MFGLGALSAGERLFAVGHSAVHPDGGGGRARQHGDRTVPGLQRGVLRRSRRAGQRHDRRLRAVRRGLRLVDRHRRHLLQAWRSRKCAGTVTTRRSRPAPWPPPARSTSCAAVGADRDLRHRRGAVADQTLCRGVHSRFRAGRALCDHRLDRCLAAKPRWIPKVAAMPLGVRLRASLGMWKLGVLFFFAVFGIYLGWFSPTEAAAMAAFVAILIAFGTRAMGWRDLLDCLLEIGLHHRHHLLHRRRRLHLLALHRADPVPERVDPMGATRSGCRRSGSSWR